MSLGNLTANILAQLDNPECSYLSGIVLGAGLTSITVFRLFFLFLLFRIITDLLKLGFDWGRNKLKLRKAIKEKRE